MPSSNLPIDFDNPEVRDYLALVRLQVLTPLSLLINIAVIAICTFVTSPSIGSVFRDYETAISPRPVVIAIYVLVIYASQLGYSVLLVTARKEETKKTMVRAVGTPLVLANWTMALWAISWIMQYWIVSTILLGIQLALLLFSNIALLIYHPPTPDRPLDTLLIHTPLRFFLILPMTVLFPTSLFVTLHLWLDPNHPDHTASQWAGWGVLFGLNMLGLLIVVIRRDLTWAIAATWICISIWSTGDKPTNIFVTTVLFTALHPVAFLTSSLIHIMKGRQRAAEEEAGRIRLEGQENDIEPSQRRVEGPREVEWDE